MICSSLPQCEALSQFCWQEGGERRKKKRQTNTAGQCSQQEDLHSLVVFCCKAAGMAGSRDTKSLMFQIMTNFRAGKCPAHECLPSPEGARVCGGRSRSKAQRKVKSRLRRKSGHGADPVLPQSWLHRLLSWDTATHQQPRNLPGHPPPCLIPFPLTNVSSKPAAGCCQLWMGGN